MKFVDDGGAPLSMWQVRAGMMFTRTEYSHGHRTLVGTLETTKTTLVYYCPIHGIIEEPTWHEDEVPEDSGYYCPINLTGKTGAMHDGITDEVCGKDVEGPFRAAFNKTTIETMPGWKESGGPADFYPTPKSARFPGRS